MSHRRHRSRSRESDRRHDRKRDYDDSHRNSSRISYRDRDSDYRSDRQSRPDRPYNKYTHDYDRDTDRNNRNRFNNNNNNNTDLQKKEKEKPKSGIFQYLSTIVQPEIKETMNDEKKQPQSLASISVNSSALKRVIENDKRSGDRYDRNRLNNASKLLQQVGSENNKFHDEPLHLKTVSSITGNGEMVKDGYSHGLKPDIASEKSFPYCCDVCNIQQSDNQSTFCFVSATQLSDHLKTIHNINRHPSLIKPKKQNKSSSTLLTSEDIDE